MITLNVDDLMVESFATVEGTAGPTLLGSATGPGEAGCEEVYFAPITAHTDPCDVCCQQQ